ncbi:MAG TPA: response regulator transcription factor [Brevundimonas sp.]|nr:response regulator transcription factor [Brevundimonas sp.]
MLLIGADASSRGALAGFLSGQAFRVLEAAGRAEAVSILATESIDLVVLDDASLYDGLGLCRDLAATVGAPIVMIADCQDQTDRIIALEVGADEILARPCHNRELLARMRALLRRSGRTGPAGTASRADTGGWVLNDAMRVFQSPSGRETALTPLEHRLLRAFMDAQGRIMDRSTVAEAFGPGALVCHSNFRTCMCRLRRKLGKDASGADVLRTIRGKGYVLSVQIQLH